MSDREIDLSGPLTLTDPLAAATDQTVEDDGTVTIEVGEQHAGATVDVAVSRVGEDELRADGGEPQPAADIRHREDCLADSVVADGLYPRAKIHQRIRDHAADHYANILAAHEIDADDLTIRWCMIEDGVILYKATHDDLPTLPHEWLPTTGPGTEAVGDDSSDETPTVYEASVYDTDAERHTDQALFTNPSDARSQVVDTLRDGYHRDVDSDDFERASDRLVKLNGGRYVGMVKRPIIHDEPLDGEGGGSSE